MSAYDAIEDAPIGGGVKASEWKPIESAPKDGTPILAYKPDERRSGDYTAVVYWADTNHMSGWVFVAGLKPPPANWPKQEQEFFKALPPQMQHAYLDRARYMTADYTRKTQELAQIRKAAGWTGSCCSPPARCWR